MKYEVSLGVNDTNIAGKIKGNKEGWIDKWIGHILLRNYLLIQGTGGKIQGEQVKREMM